MINETFAVVSTMTLVGSFAIAFVLSARRVLRSSFGAHIAYASWIAVPLAVIATLLPAPHRPVAVMLRASRSIIGVAHMPQASMPFDWRPSLLIVWLAGVVATAFLFAIQQRRFLGSLGCLQAVERGVVRADSVDTGPVLVGAWRPLIVVPADFATRYAPVERDLVIAHERFHRERGDTRINVIVAALHCLNWFNPIFHHAAARFRFDQELSCDAAVIARFPEARRSYAGAMLKTQLAGQSRQELRLPVGCRWPSGHPLKERILMLNKSSPSRARRAAGIAIVAAFGACGAIASWASQSPVSARDTGVPVIETNFVISHRDASGKHEGFTLADASGEPISFGLGADPAQWTGEFTARTAENGVLDFRGTVRFGGIVVSQPSVQVRSGTPATLEISTPDGSDGIRMEVTMTLHEPGWAPQVTEAGDQPAEENTSYRQSFPPHYPQEAIDAHQTGHVEIKVLVDEHGAPRSAEVANAAPPEVASVFGPESVKTVMQWRFHPARKEGKPVSSYILVPIDFSLDG
ncbi:MAG: TonB family protein [Dokdonella sp.]